LLIFKLLIKQVKLTKLVEIYWDMRQTGV